MIKALINGDWENVPEAHLQLGADTFAYKPGLYETFRTLNHKSVFLEPHLDRLIQSADRIGLTIPFTQVEIFEMVKIVISDFPDPDQRTRILAMPNNLIIYTSALELDNSIYSGIAAITVHANRETPDVKTTNYKVCLKAWRKANDMGCFESILIDGNGVVLEGSRSNVFWGKDGILMTRQKNVLPGITRQTLISRSPFPVSFGLLNQSNFTDVDELFITNSGSGVIPVIKVDSMEIGTGEPGPITKQLLLLYNQWIHDDC